MFLNTLLTGNIYIGWWCESETSNCKKLEIHGLENSSLILNWLTFATPKPMLIKIFFVDSHLKNVW